MSAPPNWKSALTFIWGQYRIWAATARAYQARLSSWRRRVLIFGIAGAVVGTLSSQLPAPKYPESLSLAFTTWGLTDWIRAALPLVSAGLLALATYCTAKILTPANEGGWLRARSVAEAFKREAYLLLAQAPPYDVPITPASLERIRDIANRVEDLDEEPVSAEEKAKGMPAALLTTDDYIRDRVAQQVEWYRNSAAKHRAVANRIKNISLWLGAAATLFGAVGAFWAPTAALVAVVTTITTSLATYLYAGRYQYLVLSYLATARKLEERVLEWDYSGKTEDERKQFVLDCEGIFAAENSAWMAELSKRDRQAQDTSRQGPSGSVTQPPAQTTPPASTTSPAAATSPAPSTPQVNGGADGEGVVEEKVKS